MKKIGVILSGSGVFDGSEIHEATLILLYIEKEGAEYLCMAPNVEPMHTINHINQNESKGEVRNVLIESARIARGNMKNIKDVTEMEIDGLILPGGYGAVKNLCDFAIKGAECEINRDVKELISNMHKAKKPIGAICIAPAVVARAFKGMNVKPKLTIGTDKETAEALEKMGAVHLNCKVDDIVVDEDNKIVSTPAYMLAGKISDLPEGIEKLVKKVISFIK